MAGDQRVFHAAMEAIQHLDYSAMQPEQLQVVSGHRSWQGCIHSFADWLG